MIELGTHYVIAIGSGATADKIQVIYPWGGNVRTLADVISTKANYGGLVGYRTISNK